MSRLVLYAAGEGGRPLLVIFSEVAGLSGVGFDIVTAGRQDPVLDGSEFFVRKVTLTPHFFVQNQQFFRIGGILGPVFEKSGTKPEANQKKGREYAE